MSVAVPGCPELRADLQGLLTVTLLGLLAMWLSALLGGWFCPLELLAGIHCPLCGGTRAAAAVLGGNVSAAWALNPGVTFAAVSAPPLLAGFIILAGLDVRTAQIEWVYRQARILWLLITAVLLVANWLIAFV